MKPITPSTLWAIMSCLLAPDGCPWDREQTHQTLARFLREETAEVLDAISRHSPNNATTDAHLCSELGDLWLQIAFHAALANQRGAFDIHDVEAMVVEKLIRRHPHVFGEAEVENSSQVMDNWQAIKREEKEHSHDGRLLAKIPQTLSCLDAAMEVGHICAKVGFDWPNIDGVLEKVAEEISELREENDPAGIEAEFGDVLFSLVQWARHKQIDPEMALRRQLDRFATRFGHVEECAKIAGGWENFTLEQMELAWEEAKQLQ